jgi:hypothetical protein
MELLEYENAIDQLVGAAELVASGVTGNEQISAVEMLTFFRLQRGRLNRLSMGQTADDELFADTAIAALTLAGRKEYLAASALLEQARSLLTK